MNEGEEGGGGGEKGGWVMGGLGCGERLGVGEENEGGWVSG